MSMGAQPANSLPSPTIGLPGFDLTQVIRKVAKEHSDWTPERLLAAEAAYRAFLLRVKTTPRPHGMGANERDADQVWHAHILYNMRQYEIDTVGYLGYFLYHRSKQAGKIGCSCDDEDGEDDVCAIP